MNSVRASAQRTNQGMSLVELLVATVVMGIAFAGISGALVLNNMSSVRTQNKVDDLNAARQVVERIGRDVRMARNIGDVFGSTIILSGGPPIVTGTQGSKSFPSGLNPLYGAGQAPSGGWPTPPWPNRPYALSRRTLVIQIPIFDANGFPTMIPQNQLGAGTPSVNQDNVETLVYQVLPDPVVQGEFVIQMCRFPGWTNPPYAGAPALPTSHPIINPPVTILRGLVGPLDSTAQPNVFSFLDRTDSSGTPRDAANLSNSTIANVTGIIVNLEIRRQDAGAQGKATLGLKSEVFMRNNTLSTTTGP